MTMMWPLTVEGKGLDVSAHWAELTRFVAAAARDGLPVHEMERGLWQALLRLGHDLQAQYFALASAVAEALAPPRPVAVIFPWSLRPTPAGAIPTTNILGCC